MNNFPRIFQKKNVLRKERFKIKLIPLRISEIRQTYLNRVKNCFVKIL